MSSEETDSRVYTVLVNHEEQYSLWLKSRPIPKGWRSTGQEGSKEACLEYVSEVWTDMTPLSLRRTEASVYVDPAADTRSPP